MQHQFSNSVDFLLHVQPEQFESNELSTLRGVCTAYKQQICDFLRSLHAAKRADILRYMTAFPTVSDVRLVELDFGVWAAHCAHRFAMAATSHIAWFRSALAEHVAARGAGGAEGSGDESSGADITWCRSHSDLPATKLISRLLGCAPLDLGAEHEAAMTAIDLEYLIVRLTSANDADGLGAKGRLLASKGFAAYLLDWHGRDAALPDGRRGSFHAPLESVIDWWAARGRTIDAGAAFFYLHYFTRVFGVGTAPSGLQEATQARSEILALHGFLRSTVLTEPAGGLLRAIRQQFGAERTVALQLLLSCAARGAPYKPPSRHDHRYRSPGSSTGPGVGYHTPGLFLALMEIFQEMVSEVAGHDLTTDARGIVQRKWTAILSFGSISSDRGMSARLIRLRSAVNGVDHPPVVPAAGWGED